VRVRGLGFRTRSGIFWTLWNAAPFITTSYFTLLAEPQTLNSFRERPLLRWRLISAAVILSVLLTLVWLDFQRSVFATPGVWLLPVLILVAMLGTGEVIELMRAKGHQPLAWIVFLSNFVIPLSAAAPVFFQLAGRPFPDANPLGRFGWPLVALALAAIAVLLGETMRFRQSGTAVVDAALAIFALVYVGLLTSFWPLLRLYRDNGWGMLALLSLLVIVKVADTGAFAAGKNLGRNKMTPLLSPGKTWEGFVGGLVSACLASWCMFHYAGPAIVGSAYVEPPLSAAMIYGLLLALAGMVGDLAESLLKRDMERKDSSTWLPGLGGVLDIIDAVLVAGPVAWLCWVLGLVGPGT
jgi:phosphatidate cytidylyltransferase